MFKQGLSVNVPLPGFVISPVFRFVDEETIVL
jgi:hypothetical protein